MQKGKISLPYANTSYQQINPPAPPGTCDYGTWARGDTAVAHGTVQTAGGFFTSNILFALTLRNDPFSTNDPVS